MGKFRLQLHPEASDTTWQHIVATFDGSTTKFYIDGSYVAQLNASKGNNIYHVGNHSGNQRYGPNISTISVCTESP